MTDRKGSTLQQLAGQLTSAARDIDAQDFSGLAQMHGWCEDLARAAGHETDQPDEDVIQSTASITQQLEGLILGEVEDVESALQAMVQETTKLIALVGESSDEELNISLATESLESADVAEPVEIAESVDEAIDEVDPDLETLLDSEEPLTGDPTLETTEEPTSAVETEATVEADVTVETETNTDIEEANVEEAGESTEASACSNEPIPDSYQPEPLSLNESEIEFVKGFVEEAGEHIEAIEAALLDVEQNAQDSEKINDLFRPFHTIKGMAGFLNLRDINSLTHEAETLLDQGRRGNRAITPGLIDLVFEVVDVLKVQVGCIAGHLADPQGDVVEQPPVAAMIDRLRGVVTGRIDPEGEAGKQEKATASIPAATPSADAANDTPVATTPELQTGPDASADSSATSTTPSSEPAGTAATGTPRAGQAGLGDLSVRIDTHKLDALVDMVGELVIAQTLVAANNLIGDDPKLSRDADQVTKIVRNVQAAAMAMRMVPVGGTFHKMARLIRDVSRKADKNVELVISGEETELDKNVIQQINDPLVHMVRNAVDHGVESPEERIAAGKDPVGHVHLSAYHQGGSIVIEISDDGKGLDPEVLIRKGIEKGVVQPGEELSDQQAYQLIFAPGFSTAAQITTISGRGVGMDVVKRNIEQLRGKIEITSEKGKGSVFAIHLPLTLAIIDGMVVSLNQERFIIPTLTIEQALRPTAEQVSTVQKRGEVVQIRGELIPLIQMGELFHLTGRIDPCQTMVVICNVGGKKIGLIVEDLLGQQQVVIKSLGERFEKLQGTAGAAILGDGRVGLILDPTGLAAAHAQHTGAGTIEQGTLEQDEDDDQQVEAELPKSVS